MGHGQKAMKIDGNVESHAGTKKNHLVRWMAMPNILTNESPDTQKTCYGLRVAKMDADTQGCAGQVLACSRWATVLGLRRRMAISRVMSGEAKP